jgi:hypothetical protein
MTLDDVNDLKAKLLAPMKAQIGMRAAQLENTGAVPPDARVAVGYSPQKSGYRLEVRVQRKGGSAWEQARNVQKQYPSEVNVAVIESVEVPPLGAIAGQAPYSKSLTMRPLRLGSSVSHLDDSASGSIGGFVLDSTGRPAILSCSHVLALAGRADKELRVIHPGRLDVPTVSNANLIGDLGRFAVLSRGGANGYDAAYAALLDGIACAGNVVPDEVGAPAAAVGQKVAHDPDLVLGPSTSVAKIGRSSGYTTGVLNAIGVDHVPVMVHGIGIIYFDNCFEIRWKSPSQPFTRPGDSGSLVFTTDQRKALGLHFAGADVVREGQDLKVCYACDVETILAPEGFNLTWQDD